MAGEPLANSLGTVVSAEAKLNPTIEKINEDRIMATLTTKINKNNDIGKFIKDDGYAIVDANNGSILKEESLTNILIENDYFDVFVMKQKEEFKIKKKLQNGGRKFLNGDQ